MVNSMTIGAGAFPYEAVLWDIDGTLADSEPVHLQSFVDACTELNVALPDGFHDRLLGKTDEITYDWLCANCGLKESLSDWVEKRFEHYLRKIENVKPFSEAVSVWNKLALRGVAQATVSNSDRIIVQRNLDQIGINRSGFVSVALNDVCTGKPDPESYLRAAHLLGIDPSKCAVVEDSHTGAQAGLNAGMGVYLMPWYEGPFDPKHQRFVELIESVK